MRPSASGSSADDERSEGDGRGGDDERGEADEAAQMRRLAALAELRDVAHRRIAEAERGEGAEDEEPDPGIGEDAVFVLAHEPGEHHLRGIGEAGAAEPDDERDRRRAARHAGLVRRGDEIAGAPTELARAPLGQVVDQGSRFPLQAALGGLAPL